MKILEGFHDIGGEVIRDNEIYKVIDNRHLKNLVVSKTILKPKQKTTGHKHEGVEEIYFFFRPAILQIDNDMYMIEGGEIVLIDSGEFHKVFNPYSVPLEFVSIFQAYDREKK